LNDYATYKDSNNLKVAKVEKELNDYKATMQQVNINQEPKQTATGYGIVSLPKNAANGQVSAVVKGMTLKNELNYNRDTWAEWELLQGSTIESNNLKIAKFNSITVRLNANFKTNTKYGFIFYKVNSGTSRLSLSSSSAFNTNLWFTSNLTGSQYVKAIETTKSEITLNRVAFFTSETSEESMIIKDIRCFELPTGSEIENDFETLTADQLAQKYPYINGDGTKSTFGAIRLKSVNEDETKESTLYILGRDEEGNILELRSLPKGTKDEFNITEGKATIRTEEVVFNGSENWVYTATYSGENTIGFYLGIPDMKTSLGRNLICDKFIPSSTITEDIEQIYGGIGGPQGAAFIRIARSKLTTQDVAGFKAWLQANPVTLIYQLAEPIIIPVQVSGNLVTYPSGTIYIEPVVADAGVYTDKMTVLHQDLPIKVLEKLSKIDFMTRLETELGVSDAVIAEDKLSFTHPDLVDGDIVFFTYEYDRESTEGETEIEYYDSRYVVKDSVTGKFYKWHITVANGVPSIELKEV